MKKIQYYEGISIILMVWLLIDAICCISLSIYSIVIGESANILIICIAGICSMGVCGLVTFIFRKACRHIVIDKQGIQISRKNQCNIINYNEVKSLEIIPPSLADIMFCGEIICYLCRHSYLQVSFLDESKEDIKVLVRNKHIGRIKAL